MWGIAKSSSSNFVSTVCSTLISNYQSCQFGGSSLNAWQNAHFGLHSGVLRIIWPRLQMGAISRKVTHIIRLTHMLFLVCPTITARVLGKDDGKEVIATGCWLKPAFAEIPSRIQTAPITCKNTILRQRWKCIAYVANNEFAYTGCGKEVQQGQTCM